MDARQIIVGLFTFICLVSLVIGCSQFPDADTAKDKSELAIQKVRGYLDEVEAYIETVDAGLKLAQQLEEDLKLFREAYDKEEWVTALSVLRGSVDVLRAAEPKIEVPTKIYESLAAAEAVLMLAGSK